MKIKLKLWRVGKVVSAQMLEGTLNRQLSEHVYGGAAWISIDWARDYISIPSEKNFSPASLGFDTEENAQAYLERVVGWLDEVFAKKPEKGDEVKVSDEDFEEWLPRILLHDAGDKYHNRYIVAGRGKCSSLVVSYSQMKTTSGYNPETEIYEGEI